jgi:drug/metabolite transporter (DMT)-like permease
LLTISLKGEYPMFGKYEWLVYVAFAGLSWGTYVPLIAYGGKELGGNRFAAFLCVGVAYFLIAVLLPLLLFMTGSEPWPLLKPIGLTFASLAGVAGAVGALGVIFATKAAGGPRSTNALFIAPLIFGLAPLINTIVSSFWHPQPGHPWHFGVTVPGWKLWVGIVLIGLGAALVLFSKEEVERGSAKAPAAPARSAVAAHTPTPTPADPLPEAPQ